ncbi:MAG: amino acid ABC transporter permease [Pelagibacteraceae bacterium]|nr:amino acid ABC transporter permease [Pelagibacteraceae bacterium]OUV88272.1 MAG: amino acid ABC transporter permease [Pelagibacteraceae bacterium TMED146]|tara:strand:- start:2241 stop:3437 length:1197 start_codon:yes stop_codon:yes gene_type:complete
MSFIQTHLEKIDQYLNDHPKIKFLLPQVILIIFVLSIIFYFSFNASSNLSARGINTGFGFLSNKASFDIQFSLIEFNSSMTYGRAYLVGLLNTILVSVIGILFATILGFIFGILRLSSNPLASGLATTYIEFFRNVSLLLQLFFWYFTVLRLLPQADNSLVFFDTIYANIKGIYFPEFIWTNLSFLIYGLIFTFISIYFFNIYARRLRENSGKILPQFLISLGILIILPTLVIFMFGVGVEFSHPKLEVEMGIANYIGGSSIIPEFLALAFALSIYTSTFIAENVRAGILGIDKGQKEAAASIGLTNTQILRLVVIPQALRIIIPPTTNQYLNLTKNSSLAAAIAYPDIVLVFAGTALMQTGRAIEIVTITMLTYLTLSISISIFMNWYNKKVSLTER